MSRFFSPAECAFDRGYTTSYHTITKPSTIPAGYTGNLNCTWTGYVRRTSSNSASYSYLRTDVFIGVTFSSMKVRASRPDVGLYEKLF